MGKKTLLEPGQELRTEFSDVPVKVGESAGEGGQAEVYQAHFLGKLHATKWFKPEFLAVGRDLLRERLRRLREKPAPSSKFLWPIDLVVSAKSSDFGYIMPWREDRFRELHHLLFTEDESAPRLTLRARTSAGLELAESFGALHHDGCCYHDINFGNVAIDPENGEVRICDNDNVDVNGKPGQILGAPRFMAPEIVRRQVLPTYDTDVWSLAVLLFWLFMEWDPLRGRRDAEHALLTIADEDRLYADPLFIFDPHDHSNEAMPGVHDRALLFWSIYPSILREAFTQTFTIGTRQPRERVLDGRWLAIMSWLRDKLMACSHCHAENFYEQGSRSSCWNCAKPLGTPLCIALPGNTIVLSEGTLLFRHHMGQALQPRSGNPIARVVRHPQRADIVGLENLQDADSPPWRVVFADGQTDQVSPRDQESKVRLLPGMQITFGPFKSSDPSKLIGPATGTVS